MKRMLGDPTAFVATPDPRDKRFADREWSENAFFAFIKETYLISSGWLESELWKAAAVRATHAAPSSHPPRTSVT